MMYDAKLATNQFIGKVGIDAARIQRLDPVLEFPARFLRFAQFDLRRSELPGIVAPRQHAVGTEHNITGEEQKQEYGDRRPESREQ